MSRGPSSSRPGSLWPPLGSGTKSTARPMGPADPGALGRRCGDAGAPAASYGAIHRDPALTERAANKAGAQGPLGLAEAGHPCRHTRRSIGCPTTCLPANPDGGADRRSRRGKAGAKLIVGRRPAGHRLRLADGALGRDWISGRPCRRCAASACLARLPATPPRRVSGEPFRQHHSGSARSMSDRHERLSPPCREAQARPWRAFWISSAPAFDRPTPCSRWTTNRPSHAARGFRK